VHIASAGGLLNVSYVSCLCAFYCKCLLALLPDWLLHIQDLFGSILRLEGGNTLIFNTNMSFAITKLQRNLIQGLKL